MTHLHSEIYNYFFWVRSRNYSYLPGGFHLSSVGWRPLLGTDAHGKTHTQQESSFPSSPWSCSRTINPDVTCSAQKKSIARRSDINLTLILQITPNPPNVTCGWKSREGFYDLELISAHPGGGPGRNLRILPAAASGLFSAKIFACSDRVFSLCFVTFTEILSSQMFFPSFMDMRRKDFRVPGPGDIA